MPTRTHWADSAVASANAVASSTSYCCISSAANVSGVKSLPSTSRHNHAALSLRLITLLKSIFSTPVPIIMCSPHISRNSNPLLIFIVPIIIVVFSSPVPRQSPVYSQQHAPYKQIARPQCGIPPPGSTLGRIMTALSYKLLGRSCNILYFALFRAVHIAISLKRHLVLFNINDTVIYILARSNLGQYSIANFRGSRAGEHNLVAPILQERTHTNSTHTERHIVPAGNQRTHLLKKHLIRKFNRASMYATPFHHYITSAWHNSAASLSGRQPKVYKGTFSIRRPTLSQILL